MTHTHENTHVLTFEELKDLLWDAADILRGNVDAADFKRHILGLLTYKARCLCHGAGTMRP